MKEKLKFVPIIFLCAHFVFTLLFLAPTNPLTKYYAPLVNSYMLPLFAQNWALFAPEPSLSSLSFHVNCDAKNSDHWFDPLKSILREHQKYRVSHHGRLYFLFQGEIRKFHNQFIAHKKEHEQVLPEFLANNEHLDALKKIGSQFCRAINHHDSKFAQVRVWQKFPVKFSKLVNEKNKDPDVTLVFESEPFSI